MPNMRSNAVSGNEYRVSEKGTSWIQVGTSSKWSWHGMSSPFATLTVNDLVGIIGRCRKEVMESLIKLWIDSLSIKVINGCLPVEAMTPIIFGANHPSKA